MTEKLKTLAQLVDEREEVYFLVLVVLLSVGWLGLDRLTGTEYIAGVATLYGLLIAGGGARALAARSKGDA